MLTEKDRLAHAWASFAEIDVELEYEWLNDLQNKNGAFAEAEFWVDQAMDDPEYIKRGVKELWARTVKWLNQQPKK